MTKQGQPLAFEDRLSHGKSEMMRIEGSCRSVEAIVEGDAT